LSAARALVDLAEPLAPGLVGLGLAHLLEQLADHRCDADQLGGLLDHRARRGSGQDHRHGLWVLGGWLRLVPDRHGVDATTRPEPRAVSVEGTR
jgi:hypothetical protein